MCLPDHYWFCWSFVTFLYIYILLYLIRLNQKQIFHIAGSSYSSNRHFVNTQNWPEIIIPRFYLCCVLLWFDNVWFPSPVLLHPNWGKQVICFWRMHSVNPQEIRYNYNTLQWRHNERDDASNHRRLECLLNRLFRRRSKKTSKPRVTGLCERNSPVTGDAENISIWWRHHENKAQTNHLHHSDDVQKLPKCSGAYAIEPRDLVWYCWYTIRLKALLSQHPRQCRPSS